MSDHRPNSQSVEESHIPDLWRVQASEKGGRWWVLDATGGMLFACSQHWADRVVEDHNLLQRMIASRLAGPDDSEAMDAARFRWFRDCDHERQQAIVEAAAGQSHLLEHHIDKGMCWL